MRIVLATRNQGKIREMKALLEGLPVEVLTLDDFSDLSLPQEDGRTFEENALKKAKAVAEATGLWALSDDSGLEVDHLGGKPGIHSARYAGEGSTDEENNRKLLKELNGVPAEKRKARYRCVIALVGPKGESFTFEGECEGIISEYPKGEGGFGYDPIFFLPEKGKTMAELRPEEKNRISHRGKALGRFREWLKEYLKRP